MLQEALFANCQQKKQSRCYNLNSIYNFSSYILYFNYLSNEGLFSLFSFFEVASSFFLFFLRLFYNPHQLKAVPAGVFRLSRGNGNFVTGKKSLNVFIVWLWLLFSQFVEKLINNLSQILFITLFCYKEPLVGLRLKIRFF